MTSTWTLNNGDGFNVFTTTLVNGVDADTDVLFINPTFKSMSIFIQNPGRETLALQASNKHKEDQVLADLIKIFPDVKTLTFSDEFNGPITSFNILAGGIVTVDVEAIILEVLR